MTDFAAFTLLALYLAHIALVSQRLNGIATLAGYVRRLVLETDMSQNGEDS
jgi:hypothetical protein